MEKDRHVGGVGGSRTSSTDYVTLNYLFAAWLQTREGGGHRLHRVEVVKPGKAKFFFDMTEETASELKLQWIGSSCAEFERIRKATIDLAFR